MGKHNNKRPETVPVGELVPLTGLERILLQGILPQQGNLLSIRILHDLRMALGFDSEERSLLPKREGDAVLPAELEVIPERAILIGPTEREMIVTGLKRLDKEKQVMIGHLPLFEKFDVS